LDRDGTIILDKHYLADPAGVELIPGAAAALARARALGYRLYLLTNQSGIGRGMYTLDDVHRCNDRMDELLGLPRPIFDGICIAPEHDQPWLYRKPSPRYILETIERDRLDPAQCWMVGDRQSDIDAGLNAKIHSVAVCTGKHDAAGWAALNLPGVPVFPDLAAFVATLS
ncbi:MAG: HAD-IIIA family hydrolase, partial [Verrucomicrobia bacterium]|nr:HAD-IIIA family hydrolase [Verrucomicrobiota bacterium]